MAGTGEQPGLARISPDMRTLVVTNRGSGSVSIFGVEPYEPEGGLALPGLPSKPKPATANPVPHLRAAFSGCPGATDAVILPDSIQGFHRLLRRTPGHGRSRSPPSPTHGPQSRTHPCSPTACSPSWTSATTPIQLALKPDGGEIFCSNFGSGTFSEIDTQTNEVGGTYPIGTKPSFGLVDAGNSTLWVSNFGSDSINLWSIDDAKKAGSVPAGHAPDALAFSNDQHLLLAADAQSGDVSVIRTADKNGDATLFTILPAGASPNDIVVKAMQNKP